MDHGLQHLAKLESEVVQLKEEINVKSEELDVRLRCYNEFQMATARNAERDLRYLEIISFFTFFCGGYKFIELSH